MFAEANSTECSTSSGPATRKRTSRVVGIPAAAASTIPETLLETEGVAIVDGHRMREKTGTSQQREWNEVVLDTAGESFPGRPPTRAVGRGRRSGKRSEDVTEGVEQDLNAHFDVRSGWAWRQRSLPPRLPPGDRHRR